jgi:hypothetical protein
MHLLLSTVETKLGAASPPSQVSQAMSDHQSRELRRYVDARFTQADRKSEAILKAVQELLRREAERSELGK